MKQGGKKQLHAQRRNCPDFFRWRPSTVTNAVSSGNGIGHEYISIYERSLKLWKLHDIIVTDLSCVIVYAVECRLVQRLLGQN